MTHSRLADELRALRRQIALLRAREVELELALRTLTEEAPQRPGWPIRRLSAVKAMAPVHERSAFHPGQ